MLSFVIPAHNEAQIIEQTLGAVMAAAAEVGQPFEVVVVDDASSDETARLAGRCGARVVAASVRHIAAARNIGARAATGQHLFFIDADTVVTGATIAAALRAMRAGAAGGGARVRFDGPVPRWARPGAWLTLQSFRVFNLTVGCFMFCTRDAFDRLGGFDERLFAAEEVAFSLALKRIGRLVLVEPAVVTSARKFRTHSALEIARTVAATLTSGAVLSRRRLHLWYGERRDDPGPTHRS